MVLFILSLANDVRMCVWEVRESHCVSPGFPSDNSTGLYGRAPHAG